jgi:serine/threonine-protein kinase ATR
VPQAHITSLDFSKQQIASSWLISARLHRKSGLVDAAYDAVLHATHLHDGAARLEHSRLLWRDGHHRKAIQNLQGAVEADVFASFNKGAATSGSTSIVKPTGPPGGNTAGVNTPQNPVLAKSQLLLAKWMDSAGQTKSDDIRQYYLQALKSFNRWEKAHYYMGKYYLKVLDSEKSAPRAKQTEAYLTADCQKLVIENFMRSMVFGAKYYHQTVPKMLTLWLDLGADLHAAEKNPRNLDQYHAAKAKKLETVHKQVKKYFDRLPSYIFYTALPQIMSRINHPHPKVSELLTNMISKITSSYPQQALWSLLAVAKAKATDKSSKATLVINQLKRAKASDSPLEMKTLILQGQRLSEALLYACEVPVDQRASHTSLQRDLGFNHKLAPSHLVVPVEKTLTAALPLGSGGHAIRGHRPFPRNPITISSFQDDVLVLSSLQRPRKLTIRGSDGELYGLLCKPKDDLRKDQRLMEFTYMIDRALKRDVESSKRRMYIRTYAVTPLNEECGAIEWVDGLKPMRDIILANYKSKGVRPDYGELRQLLDKACADPEHGSSKIFTEQVLPKFPPVLYEWFIETFPSPDSWFTARLRYTRSCAVMSIVGHVLGLGDRHGENILLEEGNGGCFHVDFNCLFDKGLTFEKPELVPFRLTHNMIDAFGTYGYEGPFRTAAELTLKILRQYEDTLMTIMETFLYDPTTDFITKPKKKVAFVPETPTEVLESVRGKVRGLLAGETVPLSMDGYVDALVKMAADPVRLAGMYIGWCAFF